MQPLLLALVLALAPAQDPAPAPVPAPAPGAQAAAAKAEAQSAPCEELAQALQSALEEGERAELAQCLDLEALLAKATAGVDCDAKFRKGFTDGVRSTLLDSFQGSVQGALEKGGTLSFLRIRTQPKPERLLFRLLIHDGGVDYVEFSTRTGSDGKPRVDDWYLYATGEWVTESLHHLYLPFAMQQQRGLLERLLGKDQLMVKHWDKVTVLIGCVQKNQLEAGLEAYAALPEELRHDKFILLQRLRLLAGHTDHADYLRVLEDLRRYYPDDPSNDLHAIDFHYIHKQWKRSAEAVRRLRDKLGGDAYLDYLESTILLLAQDLPAARLAVEHSLEVEPERLEAHWQRVTICLAQKDHPAVLESLKRIDTLFEMQWKDLTESPEYAGFSASPQHAEWLAYLAAKK